MPKPKPTGATLVVTPSSPAPDGAIKISGCGYTPNEGIVLGQRVPRADGNITASSGAGGTARADGCFERDYQVSIAGTYIFETYQYVNGKETLMASLTFTVA